MGQLLAKNIEYPIPVHDFGRFQYQISPTEYNRELSESSLIITFNGERCTDTDMGYTIAGFRPELQFMDKQFVAVTGQSGQVYAIIPCSQTSFRVPEGYAGYKAQLTCG